jgi:diguanylate cyclase (GGDEF)-like protein
MPLSIIMADVDYFKKYNDSFGHPAGDEVLRMVSKLLQQNARGTDCVARYGGEEFVMVLVNTDTEGAAHVAERIRKAVETHEWKLRPVTLSLGVATLSLEPTTAAELLSEADFALYRSKQDGRNRVTASYPPDIGEITSAA